MRHPPKASRHSGRQGRLAGRGEEVWADRGKLAGKKAAVGEGWCNARRDVPCLMPLHCMLCHTYHTYSHLMHNSGWDSKNFAPGRKTLQNEGPTTFEIALGSVFVAPFAIASRTIRQLN